MVSELLFSIMPSLTYVQSEQGDRLLLRNNLEETETLLGGTPGDKQKVPGLELAQIVSSFLVKRSGGSKHACKSDRKLEWDFQGSGAVKGNA